MLETRKDTPVAATPAGPPRFRMPASPERRNVPGDLVLDVARSLGVPLSAPCGGAGTCGKCRVLVLDGATSPATEEEHALLPAADLATGTRLACRCHAAGGSHIEVITDAPARAHILTHGRSAAVARDVRPSADGHPALGVAVDVGTTTVAAGLIDLRTGDELTASTAINPQSAVGHDVLTRIREAGDPARADHLAGIIRTCIDCLIAELCTQARVSPKAIVEVVVAGNTAMTHLLLGLDVRGLGRAPYRAADLEPSPCRAADLGWRLGREAQVAFLPAVSAFVGGDVVAGLLAVDLTAARENVLLVDMGTNGELLLAAEGRLWACSCAAGPAFEGMGISHGVRAGEGAIDGVTYTGGAFDVSTIGGVPAAGLCGSGVIDATAALLAAGVVAPSGRFRATADAPWSSLLRQDPTRLVLSFGLRGEVSFSQGDVRQVQLAKGAIASGICALLDAAGLEAARVARLLIAGQFGHHVSVESLVALGLVPFELRDRVEVVGNTSKSGATMCLLSRRHRALAAEAAGDVRHIELSTLPGFDRLLARNMAFPARGPVPVA